MTCSHFSRHVITRLHRGVGLVAAEYDMGRVHLVGLGRKIKLFNFIG